VVQAHVQGTRLVLIPRVPVQIITKELQKHGWNPMVEKESIVVPVPKVTKQQQQEMIKEWWVIGNKVKNSIRGYRQEARKAHGKEYDKEIQASTDGWITKIDSLIESKIKDL
jgi:ribosome recycling factor